MRLNYLSPPVGSNRLSILSILVIRSAFAALTVLAATFHISVAAAPFTPASDAEVVERLPGRASDPAVKRVDSLRKQLAARPDDAVLRVEIARRYFEMAMAEGDPRYVGYASAALAPMEKAANNPSGYWMARGLIQQFSHEFEPALASLSKASQLDPTTPEPGLWRAAIFMVLARYPESLAECEKLAPLAAPALGIGCTTYVQATTGQLEAAFQTLSTTVKATSQETPELRLWQNTRLGEMAMRLQRFDVAEDYFKQALKAGITDQFLLGAYADLLLLRQRPAEVLTLLSDWERSDVLLLRLALAGKASSDKRAAGWATQLRERFAAAGLRGDRLHEQEAARFELDVEGKPAQALELASLNYKVQKEPRDAEILMRAALAAKQAKAAQPALDWLRSSRYEDAGIKALAAQLAAQGATL